MKYVTRETGNLFRDSVEPRPDADSDDRPCNWLREAGSRCDGGSTDGVERVVSRFRHGRHDQRQATTSERQRLVRQEEAATRLSHSRQRCDKDVRPINSLRRTVHNLTATHLNGRTSARSPTTPDDTQFSSSTHTDGSTSARSSGNSRLTLRLIRTHSPTTSLTTTGLLSFTHSAQLLELNSNYTVSRLHDRLTVY